MSSFTTQTVNGVMRPWNFAAIPANTGAPGTHVGYNVNFTDGSAAGGSPGQNTSYAYGAFHTHAGETGPLTVAVTPGAEVTLVYTSGTVVSGSTAFGPHGDNTAPPLFPTVDYADPNGVVYPSDCMPTAKSLNGANPTMGRGGLCGCFTDSSGNVITNSFWSWTAIGVALPNAGFPSDKITSVAATPGGGVSTTYSGTFTSGGSNAFANQFILVVGFTNAQNNGLFWCTASTTSSLTLLNPFAVAETKNCTLVVGAAIQMIVPAGAAFISMGINDTQLWDNTGSFTLSTWITETSDEQGDTSYVKRFPYGITSPAQLADLIGNGYFVPFFAVPMDTTANGLMKSYVGQLWPHGAQNYGGAPAGSNGQNFNY
jgi:hypothetical protein